MGHYDYLRIKLIRILYHLFIFETRMHSDFTAFFLSKPKCTNVSDFKPLRQFINNYPYEELRPQMRKLQKDFSSYRAIKGDGNCFYRACMFLYLSLVDLTNFTTVFPPAPIFDCIALPFCNDDNYSSEQLLRYIWMRFLQPLENKLTSEREKKLTYIFNSSEMFDAIMIAYFRSLNHGYLNLHRAKFAAYTNGGIENELRKVLTYGKQSQGVQIYSLAQLLQAKITIMMTHEVTVKAVEYLQEGMYSFRLFYRPGHYDILSDPKQRTVKVKTNRIEPNIRAASLILPSRESAITKQSEDNRFYRSIRVQNEMKETVENEQGRNRKLKEVSNESKTNELANNSNKLMTKHSITQILTSKPNVVTKNNKPIVISISLGKKTNQPTPQQTKEEPSKHFKAEPKIEKQQNIRMFIEGTILLVFFLTIIIIGRCL